jgi:hypothetical protein
VTALPAVALTRIAAATDREPIAVRLREWAAGTSTVALVVTAPAWVLLLTRGVLYPLFAGDDLSNSWGGPTLVGAWAAHFAVGVAVLLAVSGILAAFGSGDAARRPNRID